MAEYNSTYFRDGKLWYRGEPSITVFTMSDGTLLGIFQGDRGDNPELDFVLRFLSSGARSRLRTPKNIHWVVDLLIRGKHKHDEAKALVEALIDCYENSKRFTSVRARSNFVPQAAQRIARKFAHLDEEGLMPVDFVAHLVELFSICEKASPRDRKMFRDLLDILRRYFEGTKDYYQVLNATAPGYN